MSSYGERLRATMKILKRTQVQLADEIGVSQNAVSKWMSGECLPETAQILATAKFLGVPVDYLIDDSNEVCEESLRLTRWIEDATKKLGLVEAYRRLALMEHAPPKVRNRA